eukprot:TRINITY_DN15799_c2_g1_i1.p2 TRINITY_DN15799_c2_g1~~TRINITY_DN15799_c2_g1_i1.p2  ORF type:complete len:178 (+),score=54.23 TRINITY_DN15799_c2_g1_i1:288-821(+)
MPPQTVTFETSYGDFKADIYVDEMPITSANFLDLCELGFYNGLRFHHCQPGYAVRAGCPHSARHGSEKLLGTGGPEPSSEFCLRGSQKTVTRDEFGCIPDEFQRGPHLSNTVGAIAMSNCGPGTGGSQFFINLGDNKFLDWWNPDSADKHVVFGRVTSGVHIARITDQGTIYRMIVD